MNEATRNHEKKIKDLVAKHIVRGTSLEEIGRRIWICYGYLNEVKNGRLMVNMHAGVTELANQAELDTVAGVAQ